MMSFQPVVRFSGLLFSYNVAYAVFGGLMPVMVSLLLPLVKLAPAHYVMALSVVGIGLYLQRYRRLSANGLCATMPPLKRARLRAKR